MNETKRNLTRKCLIYNAMREFSSGNSAAIKYSGCAYGAAREERIVFSTLAFSNCNHKFSPGRTAGGEVVHFCIVNHIAHSLTKQVYFTPTHSARRVFPIAIHSGEIIKCIFCLQTQLEILLFAVIAFYNYKAGFLNFPGDFSDCL